MTNRPETERDRGKSDKKKGSKTSERTNALGPARAPRLGCKRGESNLRKCDIAPMVHGTIRTAAAPL